MAEKEVNDVAFPRMAGKRKSSSDSSLGISPEVYGEFSEWCDRNSLIRKEVAGKLIRWFMEQDDDALRKIVIGGTSVGLEEAYAKALEDMAAKIRTARPPKKNNGAKAQSGML
jgi:hypothetical protein